MDEIVEQNTSSNLKSLERKIIRPQKEQALNCPRCNSTNTKFCYYNNYSLTQPRYFCKGCRRYWTEGGTLRNIPFGGGSRKNKRQSPPSVSPSSTNSSKKVLQNPRISEGQDLNLGFPSSDFKAISQLIQVPNFENADKGNILGGISSGSRGLSPFVQMPFGDSNVVFPNAFSLTNEFKPTLSFSLDGFGGNGEFENLQGGQDGSNGRLLFPFEDLKQISSKNASGMGHDREHGESTGYWSGVLGNGSW